MKQLTEQEWEEVTKQFCDLLVSRPGQFVAKMNKILEKSNLELRLHTCDIQDKYDTIRHEERPPEQWG